MRTVNLYAHRTLLVADGKLAQRGVDGAHKSLGAHKLSVDHRRAITLAKMAKANVRNVFHRSKEERMRTKFDVSYFHFFFLFLIEGLEILECLEFLEKLDKLERLES